MRRGNYNNTLLATLLLSLCLCTASSAYAATSVTLTVIDPPTTLSNGKSYFLAGRSYRVRVQAVYGAAPATNFWNSIRLNFNNSLGVAVRYVTINVDNAPASYSLGASSGIMVSVIPADGEIVQNSTVPTNLDFTIRIVFNWMGTDFNTNTANTIEAVINDDAPFPASPVHNDFHTTNYGVCTNIQIRNFAQNGEAADGYVNPWHNTFTVTGNVAWWVNGEPFITTLVPNASINNGVNAQSLYLATPLLVPLPATQINMTFGGAQPLSFPVPADHMNTCGVAAATAAYRWRMSLTMNNPTAVAATTAGVLSQNTLPLRVDMIRVQSVTFQGGGGRDVPYYIRSVNRTGTRIHINARLASGILPMVGDTTFTVQASSGPSPFTVTIRGGTHDGYYTLPTGPFGFANDTTTPVTYQVISVCNGAFDGNCSPPAGPPPGSGQGIPVRIPGTLSGACYWDTSDPPGVAAQPFTALATATVDNITAVSFTAHWTPLATGPPAPLDADLDSYRLYYRRIGDPTWRMIDRSVVAALGLIGTGACTVTGLVPLTDYEFRVSAIDMFGQEVALANQIGGPAPITLTTLPTQIRAAITDGIYTYTHESFTSAPSLYAPGKHIVRSTAIKFSVSIVTAQTQPEQVNIIFANNNSDLPAQYGVTGAADDIMTLPASQRYVLGLTKAGSNTYQGYVPSTHPLMKLGTNIRFIVQTIKGGVPTYSSSILNAGAYDPTREWRFRVGQMVLFIPQPTRVLNNVLTSAIPCCFPAYFLTADSVVTIKVYDAKGRVISILSERMYRPAGQNIKEMGWCGTNKDNNRVGPGIYYIHIKATTLGNRTTLDKMLKVIVAH